MRRTFAAAAALAVALSVGLVHIAAGQSGIGTPVPYVSADGSSQGQVTIKQLDDPFTGFEPTQPAPEGSRYVEMIVTFESAEDQSFDAQPYYLVLRTTDGRLYQPSYVARPADAKYPIIQGSNLGPGSKVTGALDYVIPAAAKIGDLWFAPISDRIIELAAIDTSGLPSPGTAVTMTNDDGTSETVTATLDDPSSVADTSQPAPEGMRYVGVNAVIEDKGDQPVYADPYRFTLLDTTGQLYRPGYVPIAQTAALAELEGQTLNVGDRISGYVGFQIPIGAQVASILFAPQYQAQVTVAQLVGGGTVTPSAAPPQPSEAPASPEASAMTLPTKPPASTTP